MDKLDLFYKAFSEYKQHTKANLECVRFHKQSQALTKIDQQCLKAVFATCTIEEDWVNAIEEGIPFILKAIKEERQFIRNDGEVLPIEKIKKTSKYSIQDLAKHSNYISREPNKDMNTEIVPDKLLMIRKENDYTVYENRVVYATLNYLLEFVSSRLNIIKELTNKYEANSVINKKIVIGNRTLDFQLHLNEVVKNDPIAMKRNKYQDIINRIENIYSNIVSLIRMPLMVEVSKVDLVSRPIVKTNVLKMDNNFKHVLQLFDFIAEYNTPGYTVNVIEKTFHPMEYSTIFDYSELMMLSSFITYMHVNGLQDELKENYQKEIERLKEEEKEKILERVKHLKLKAKMSNKTIEEYLIILDEACKLLEDKNAKLQEHILELQASHKKEIKDLNDKHNDELIQINAEHQIYVANLNADHEQKINEITSNYEGQIEQIKQDCEQEKLKAKQEAELEIEKYRQEFETKLDELTKDFKAKEEEFLTLKEALLKENQQVKDDFILKEKQLNESTKAKLDQMQHEKETMEAQYLAISAGNGKSIDLSQYTSEEKFNMLERECKLLQELTEKAWKETKKQMKKDVFAVKPETKKRKKVKDESKE